MSAQVESIAARPSPPSVDNSLAASLLTFLLSVVAGATDVVGFLLLGGLFTAHITGNLVILAAHIVSGGAASLAAMLSVPVFIVMLGMARLFAEGLAAAGIASLRPLLMLQFLLLAGFLALGVSAGPRVGLDAPIVVVTGMFGVSAMAVQNVLVSISLKDAPRTAVMTSNIAKLTMDIGDMVFARDPDRVAEARRNARRTWHVIVGFGFGCALGAGCYKVGGQWSLAAPLGLALPTLALGLAVKPDEARPKKIPPKI
jgi:uncharacterized membrane protein YoaK (UPF0700 family)